MVLSGIDLDFDFDNPEEEKGFDENGEREVVNQPLRGDKSNKCNQCDYATSRSGDLRKHLKTHRREKQNKCNLCDFASSRAEHLRTHMKNTLEKSKTNATSVTMHLLRQAL